MRSRPTREAADRALQAAQRVIDDSRRDWYPTGSVSFDPQCVTPAASSAVTLVAVDTVFLPAAV
jgi:hypothetical protein